MKTKIFLLAFVFYLVNVCKAQTIKPLNIGDQMPDVTLTGMINYNSESLNLAEFKGKVVILDFWATWCQSCIKGIPRAEVLQNKMKDKLQVILVNPYNNKQEVIDFFLKRSSMNEAINLPTSLISGDINKYFPRTRIPHYVWISPGGKVQAITGAFEITEENVNKAYESERFSMPSKIDQNMEVPIFSAEYFSYDLVKNYEVFAKGWFSGFPSSRRVRKINNMVRGLSYSNTPLYSIFNGLFADIDTISSHRRVFVETLDSAKLFKYKSNLSDFEWIKKNYYNYELIVPEKDAAHLYTMMLEKLNKYVDFTGKLEKRKIKCLLLVRTQELKSLKTAGEGFSNDLVLKGRLRNGSTKLLTKALNLRAPKDLPLILDETNIKDNIDIDIKIAKNTFEGIKADLNKYGLDLIEGERAVDVWVIRDKVKR